MEPKKDCKTMFASLLTERPPAPRLGALNDLHTPEAVAAYLQGERDLLMARLLAPRPTEPGASAPSGKARQDAISPPGGLAIAHEFSDLMDAIVTRLFGLACARQGANPATLPIAIVATGGYGRGELAPYSDIDLTFIPQRAAHAQTDRVIRELFTLVMDVLVARCSLEVGYAYRLLTDCAELDHQTACGLLDARLVAGSHRIFIQFEDAFWMGFNPTEFIFAKVEERRRILEKWGRTPRVVEPQLKEGPGGLRDLQTLVWLVQARRGLTPAQARGPRAFSALVQSGYVTEGEAAELLHAKERLFQIRNALHAITGAHRDQLVITRQEEVADRLGYAMPELSADGALVPPVERFMADLYPLLMRVRLSAEQAIGRIEDSRLLLGIGLDCKRGRLVPANPSLDTAAPTWLLWAGELTQRYHLRWSRRVERAVAARLATLPELPAGDSEEAREAGQVFTRLLSKPGRVYPTLQKLADLGILGWFLPEFGALMDLIPYDPAHDFTVGQHSLRVIENLDALALGSDADDAEMRRIYAELPRPEILALAALLHDCGKRVPGRPHSEVGEEIAQAVCRRLGWTQEAADTVAFLVRHHLLMAETSRLRDLSLDETIRNFTRVVDDPDRLTMLYLLTYADTRAVGEGVWTPVKGRFLRDLWQRALAALADSDALGYDDAGLARARRRLLKDLSPQNLPEAEIAAHVQAMPPEYLLNQSANQIALHVGFVRSVRAGQPVVDFHDDPNAAYTELTVAAYDDPQPGLLAKITGALYALDVEVYSAQVVTRVEGDERIALDTLWVDFRGRPLTSGKRREISADLIAVLKGERTVAVLLQRRRAGGRGSRREGERADPPLRVLAVHHEVSETLTLVETSGGEAKAMLYRVSVALARLGWDIHSARVSIWQGAARANFYVTGARKTGAAALRRLEDALRETETGETAPRPVA